MSILSKAYMHDEAAAFAHVEALLWAGGPVCPHCGNCGKVYTLAGVRSKPSKKNPEGVERHGLKKCAECRKQFTVRIGTIFEESHIPLHLWLQAIHLMVSSKKGISSHQMHRVLGITYKSAWFLTHRIRECMRDGALADMNNLRRTENGALVRTSCILPSGSLLNVSVQPAIDGWIVCDEGAVVSDAMAHGFDVDFSLKGLANKLSRDGLKVENGRIYSARVSSGELPFMVAYLATAAIEASRWLVNSAAKHSKLGIADVLKELVDRRYADIRLNEPLEVFGNSSKLYAFDNVLMLPNRKKLILDPVTRHDGSIKSRLVANLDVAQANHQNLIQRIVYDEEDGWEQQELALLSVGAPAIKMSMVEKVVDRMAA